MHKTELEKQLQLFKLQLNLEHKDFILSNYAKGATDFVSPDWQGAGWYKFTGPYDINIMPEKPPGWY